MAFVFRRHLTAPLWPLAFLALALTAPSDANPPLIPFLAVAAIAITTLGMVRWRGTARLPVAVWGPVNTAAAMMIPGAREPGMLTTCGTAAASAPFPDGPSSMDAATITERQWEGGGAPSQRRLKRERSAWKLGDTLHQLLVTMRALFARRLRSNHV
jgi:hypothetical protein